MKEGKTIGRYEVAERVGRGGMGVLYRAIDPVLGREVAVKMLLADFANDDVARNRFFREARAVARLQHRNIVTVFEFAEEDGSPYLVMEFLRGQSLAKRLAQGPRPSISEALDIVGQLCDGLHFAHGHGVVHRDVKPGNIWLQPDDTVKLLDFGIAKVTTGTVTQHQSLVGSAQYMSPEQIEGGEVDGRTDVFAAGVVLYEMLSGRKPFEADSPTAVLVKILQEPPAPLETVASDVPPRLAAAVRQALAKQPAERFPSAADFGAELRLIRLELEVPTDLTKTVVRPPLPRPGDLPPLIVESEQTESAPGARRPLRRVQWVAAACVTVIVAVGLVNWRAVVWPDRADGKRGPTEPTTPPEPPAQPSMIAIDSDPPGATVFIDGSVVGQVLPMDLPREQAAGRRLRVVLDGRVTQERTLSADDLRNPMVTVSLPPAPVARTIVLTARGSYPFEIWRGGQRLAPRRLSHEVQVKNTDAVTVRAADVLLNRPVRLQGTGADGRLSISVPALGQLTVRTPFETCTVLIAGRDFGFPPLAKVPVVAGTYVVELKCPDGTTKREGATVTGGAEQVVVIRG